MTHCLLSCMCVCVCDAALLPAADDARVVRLLVGLVAAHRARPAHLPARAHPLHHPLLPRAHVRIILLISQ